MKFFTLLQNSVSKYYCINHGGKTQNTRNFKLTSLITITDSNGFMLTWKRQTLLS